MEKVQTIFVFRDENDEVVASITNNDMTKKVPKNVGFDFQKPRKGVKPRLLLFKTKECIGKMSVWIENWEEIDYNSKYWIKTGWSVEKSYDVKVQVKDFKDKLNGVNYKKRGEQFLNLTEEEQVMFCKLSSNDQITLLKVPNKTQSQFRNPKFSLEHLIKYADHVASTNTRRQREAQEKSEREHQETMKIIEELSQEYAVNSNYTFGMLNLTDKFDIINDHYDYDIRNNYRSKTQKGITLKPLIRQRELKNTDKVFDGLEVAWWEYKLDYNVLHRILFFCCVKFIKEERICGREYNTCQLLYYFKGRICHSQLKEIERQTEDDISNEL